MGPQGYRWDHRGFKRSVKKPSFDEKGFSNMLNRCPEKAVFGKKRLIKKAELIFLGGFFLEAFGVAFLNQVRYFERPFLNQISFF